MILALLLALCPPAHAGAGAERMLAERAATRAAAKLGVHVDELDLDADADLIRDAAGPEPVVMSQVALGELAANAHKHPGLAPAEDEHERLQAWIAANPMNFDRVKLAEIAANPEAWRGFWDGE